jgi:hypothetical protein
MHSSKKKHSLTVPHYTDGDASPSIMSARIWSLPSILLQFFTHSDKSLQLCLNTAKFHIKSAKLNNTVGFLNKDI